MGWGLLERADMKRELTASNPLAPSFHSWQPLPPSPDSWNKLPPSPGPLNPVPQAISKDPPFKGSSKESTSEGSSKDPTCKEPSMESTSKGSSKDTTLKGSLKESTSKGSSKDPTFKGSSIDPTSRESSKDPSKEPSKCRMINSLVSFLGVLFIPWILLIMAVSNPDKRSNREPDHRPKDWPWAGGAVAAIIIYVLLPYVLLIFEVMQEKNVKNSMWPMIIRVTVGFGILIIPWILFYMVMMALSNRENQDPRFNEINGVVVATILLVSFHIMFLCLLFEVTRQKPWEWCNSERNRMNQNEKIV